MGGAALDDEERAELDELRRRAFGPDADLLSDPTALARLAELEAAVERAVAPEASAGRPASAQPRPPSRPSVAPAPGEHALADSADPRSADVVDRPRADRPADPDTGGATDPLDGEIDETAAGEPASSRPWRARAVLRRVMASRRRRIASGVAVLVMVILVAGAIGWGIAQPVPDRVLAAVDTRFQIQGNENATWLHQLYGMAGPLRGHQALGNLHVWTGRSASGSECMVVTVRADDIVTATCAPRSLDVITDVYVYPGWGQEYTGLSLPVGSVIRFKVSGDDVQAWVRVDPSSSTVP